MKLFDVFICHASEDKKSFVRPLARRLEQEHLFVWYDEFSLKLGDSLHMSIDIGLARSRYGIVVLSPAFFAKRWPQRELDGLVARETSAGERIILPIWHGLTKKELLEWSPTLADLVAVSSSKGLDYVVQEILRVLRPLGSPLIIARDRLIEFGLQPPVVTDEWWLDVVAASNRDYPWGYVIENVWDLWAFPLPGGDSPHEKGEKLAWTAMQMQWTRAAEKRRISQLTPPAELLDFIFAYPGLRQACHNYPDLLATYAPQLTIPGLGGEFEDTFDRFLENSMNRAADYYGKYPPKSGRAPLIMDDEIALHHHTLANCSPASLACQFVQGDIGGPPCRVYPNFDYAIWPLSSSSNWMPRRIRKVLTAGMKEWGVWHWTDSLTNIERELEIEPYDGMGAFMTTIWQKGARTPADFGDEARADLLARIGISKRLLSLPERAETLARRFLEAGFVEEYVRRHRQTLHAGGE